MSNPILMHRVTTEQLASALKKNEIYHWLIEHGYYPEGYVLPPCFKVAKKPKRPRIFFRIKSASKPFKPSIKECVKIHFPKTELTDRVFGIIHPEIHNDISFHIAQHWSEIVLAIFPKNSIVTSYSFPIPVDSKYPGRVGFLRAGRMIYEYIGMIDDDIAAVAYQYSHIIKADIKNFYPSIYTHSIAWAIHGKAFIRSGHLHDYSLVGNILDKLFQNANDGCTNGIPIGPVASDIVAEIITGGVDVIFSQYLKSNSISCEVVRFKDDYRILAKSEQDAKTAIKLLQKALKEYNLELSDEKTKIYQLPDGLFREWASMYYSIHPKKQWSYSWKQFRELYLGVLRIDKTCPGTGVIDRFLSDIVSKKNNLKVKIEIQNLDKVISMLLMLATLRVKAFPKIMAILESILRSPFGILHKQLIIDYLENYLMELSKDEERNKYLIIWIVYFLQSNGLYSTLKRKPRIKDPIARSIIVQKSAIFNDSSPFKLFIKPPFAAAKVSMLEHLDVFNPPRGI